MKLAITLCVLCLMLLVAVLAFAWAADKLQIGPWRKEVPSPAAIVKNQQALYVSYHADYENFAEIVWHCLNDFATTLNLDCPKTELGIYSQNRANQIAQLNGSMIFRYEVPKQVLGLPGRVHRSPSEERSWLVSIEKCLQGHLQDYFRGGYLCSGRVTAWNAGNNCVRIEIHDVDRKFHVEDFQI